MRGWAIAGVWMCGVGAVAAQPIAPEGLTRLVERGALRQIEGGRLEGANLFHWFREFNVPTGTTVRFENGPGVQNVLARVTGGLPSTIDGTLAANGTANLSLVNPSGMVFGPNAQLNIGGSFLATTAETVVFGEGIFGRSPAPGPVLRVGVPLGLQFGENPAPIAVLGNGQPASTTGVSGAFAAELGGLRVVPGQTLALVGGDILVEGGLLQAPGGEVVLGGLAGPGLVGLAATGLQLPAGVRQSNLNLRENAGINVLTETEGGTVRLTGENIAIADSLIAAGMVAGAQGSRAGDVVVQARQNLVQVGGRLENNVNAEAQGNSGNIDLRGGTVTLDRAIVNTSYLGSRPALDFAGDVDVEATGNLTLLGSRLESSGFLGRVRVTGGAVAMRDSQLRATSATAAIGEGQFNVVQIRAAGDLSLTDPTASTSNRDTGFAGDVRLDAGGAIQLTNTLLESTGRAGRVQIGQTTPPQTFLMDGGELRVTNAAAEASSDVPLNAGGIFVNVLGNLTVQNFAALEAFSERLGNAGTIDLRAGGDLVFRRADAFSTVETQGNGNSGRMELQGRNIRLQEGAQLQTSLKSEIPADVRVAGEIALRATDTIQIEGTIDRDRFGNPGNFNSSLRSQVFAGVSGDAGNLILEANRVVLGDRGGLISNNAGTGSPGNITITAQQDIEMGPNSEINSTSRRADLGGFAKVSLTAQNGSIHLTNAKILTNNENTGFAGDILLNAAQNLTLRAGSTISSEGNFGRILVGEELVPQKIELQGRSRISTDNTAPEAPAEAILNAGILSLKAGERIELQEFSNLNSSTQRRGDAGGIGLAVPTGDVVLRGGSAVFSTVEAEGDGNGGEIQVTARHLQLTEGSQLLTVIRSAVPDARGERAGGLVTLEVAESIQFRGAGSEDVAGNTGFFPSGIFSSVLPEAVGRGGSIALQTNRLELQENALISATSEGTGAAGDISLRAAKIELSDRAALRADTVAGQGNISLQTPLLVLRDGAAITTRAFGAAQGGNITITATHAVGIRDSNITANAEQQGGAIFLQATGVFGFVRRSRADIVKLLGEDLSQFNPETDLVGSNITAISLSNPAPQFEGLVELNTPDADPTAGLVILSNQTLDVENLVVTGCDRREEQGTFRNVGRGGLPRGSGATALPDFGETRLPIHAQGPGPQLRWACR